MISIAPTTLAANVISIPLTWVRIVEPQSRIVNLMMYTKKSAIEIIQMTGFFRTISEMLLL